MKRFQAPSSIENSHSPTQAMDVEVRDMQESVALAVQVSQSFALVVRVVNFLLSASTQWTHCFACLFTQSPVLQSTPGKDLVVQVGVAILMSQDLCHG